MAVGCETVDDERAGVAGGDEVEDQGEDGEPAEEAAWKERNEKAGSVCCLKNNKLEMAHCLINTPGVDLDTVDRDGRYLEDIARYRNK